MLTVVEPAAVPRGLRTVRAISGTVSFTLPEVALVIDDQQAAVRALGGLAVVTLPAKVDTAASRRLCGQLGSALASAATVIADMTATRFCDSSGVQLLLLAQEQATATGVELRLVVPSAAVLRSLALTGAAWLLPVYRSLEDALAS